MQSAEQICQSLGGKKLDQAVVDLFLQTITPARVQAIITALEQAEEHVQAEQLHWQKQLEKARYEAERAKRQYDRVEPENRLVARAMELGRAAS